MRVYFKNDEAIDLRTIELMGVSIKDASAIGYFGTGLKFAIATILRKECRIYLLVNGEKIKFTSREEVVRGKTINRIYMGETALGFTTALGRDWELWQAYRELHSNCLDEDGIITDIPGGTYSTIFVVEGEKFHEQYTKRHEIFLRGDPIASNHCVQVFKEPTNQLFYKRVRVNTIFKKALFTYNLVGHQHLTEDRTLKYPMLAESAISRMVTGSDDVDFIRNIILAPQETYEGQFNYTEHDLSPTFLQVVRENVTHINLNRSALAAMRKHDKGTGGEVVELDSYNRRMFENCKPLLRYLNCNIQLEDFTVLRSLGPNVYAEVVDGKIFISLKTFDMGEKFLASTLYEEWLHKTEGLEDESRDLQNFLFEKLFSCVGRLI